MNISVRVPPQSERMVVELDRWLAAKEASRYLGVTPSTLSRWRIKGIGPEYSATMGRDPRYKLSVLEAFMSAGLVTNTIQARQKRKKDSSSV